MSIDIANESGVEVDEHELARLARFTLDRMRVHPQAELSVVLVDEKTMAEHHLRWMDEPGPTDVLAFPMDELRPGREGEEPPAGLLGDVVLCPTVADRQAKEAGHSRDDELHLLAVHGILHLLGYDHAEPDEHREMFALQSRLLAEWQPLRAGGRGESEAGWGLDADESDVGGGGSAGEARRGLDETGSG